MKLRLKVKPGAKQNKVEPAGENHYKVWVKEPPQDGRANDAVILLMSEYLKIPKSRISIIRGESAKEKILEIL